MIEFTSVYIWISQTVLKSGPTGVPLSDLRDMASAVWADHCDFESALESLRQTQIVFVVRDRLIHRIHRSISRPARVS